MPLTPYYSHSGITIYHGDCMTAPLPEGIDACVTDPPYGSNWDTNTSRFSGGNDPAHRGNGRSSQSAIHGDDRPFDPSCWLTFPQVIMFGFNHFPSFFPKGTALVWLKRNEDALGSFLSDAEIAWMSNGCGVYCYKDLSMNGEALMRCHPTQKPVGLMKWCLNKLRTPKMVIDPYMGSGTTLVAAKQLGIPAIGIEIEEKYCEIAAKRLAQEVMQF